MPELTWSLAARPIVALNGLHSPDPPSSLLMGPNWGLCAMDAPPRTLRPNLSRGEAPTVADMQFISDAIDNGDIPRSPAHLASSLVNQSDQEEPSEVATVCFFVRTLAGENEHVELTTSSPTRHVPAMRAGQVGAVGLGEYEGAAWDMAMEHRTGPWDNRAMGQGTGPSEIGHRTGLDPLFFRLGLGPWLACIWVLCPCPGPKCPWFVSCGLVLCPMAPWPMS